MYFVNYNNTRKFSLQSKPMRPVNRNDHHDQREKGKSAMIKQAFNEQWIFNGEEINLPHDAMLHEKRDPKAACGSAGAFFPGGKYTYEKKFLRPDAAHVLIQFEGVYKNARVLINGKEAGGTAYGYAPFFVDADPYLVDGENTVAVGTAARASIDRYGCGRGRKTASVPKA